MGTVSGVGADAPRQGVQSAGRVNVGRWAAVGAEDGVSLATCLCWLHLPSRGFLSLVSSVQPMSLPSTGKMLRAPVVMCHQMTQVTKTSLPQNPISFDLAGGNFDLVKFEPFHF